MDIYKINLEEKYQREIFGLGEIYEIISVNHLRKKLLKKFKEGALCLASNKNHSSRGYNFYELEKRLEEWKILKKGYVDSPPWGSQPRNEENKQSYNLFIVFLVKIIFNFLVRLEFLWQGPEKSHMIYCMVKNK